MTTINNCPSYAKSAKYIVARRCDGEWWFWGAYDDATEAYSIAHDINGQVFITAGVELR